MWLEFHLHSGTYDTMIQQDSRVGDDENESRNEVFIQERQKQTLLN